MQGKEAVALLNSLVPAGSSLSMGFSTTLVQIGYIESLKARTDVDNFKAKAVVAQASGDMAGYAKFLRQGASADYFMSGVSAITTDGDIYAVDLSGSRVAGFYSAGQLIVVTGSNKIVESDAEAEQRIQFQYKLESARVRVAYGVPHSSINNVAVIKGGNPCAFGASAARATN